MRCRYKERVIKAGDMLYALVYPEYSQSVKGKRRRARFRTTEETQEIINQRMALLKLTCLIHSNFTSSDYFVTLTYDEPPINEEWFRKDVKNFLTRIRRVYKKNNAEFKYIYIRDYDSGRKHVHAILSGGIDRDEIQRCWGLGRVRSDRLQFDETGVGDLAQYIGSKSRGLSQKRWVGSQNLVKPQEQTNTHQYSGKQLEDIADANLTKQHEVLERNYEGYALSEMPIFHRRGSREWFMQCTMFKPDSPNLAPWIRARQKRGQNERIKNKKT